MFKVAICWVFCFAFMFVTVPCFSDIIHVPGDQTTIQDGIDAAESSDTVLVADGTYSSPSKGEIDFKGLAIIVKSENGPQNCVIDCNGNHRGLNFHSNEDENSILQGFTIKNGIEQRGAGIRCYYSSPKIVNCIFDQNEGTEMGGGIYCLASTSKIQDCVFSNNTSSYGGGIHARESSSIEIMNCQFDYNDAEFDGGAVYVYVSSADIVDCTFDHNTSWRGGGIAMLDDSNTTLNSCSFTNNSVSYNGGAIYFREQDNLSIIKCDFYGNSAEHGGAIKGGDNSDPEFSMIDCRLFSNIATVRGGGMFLERMLLNISNCIIDSCSAEKGGGFYIENQNETHCVNCLVTNNSSDEDGGGIYVYENATLDLDNCTVANNTSLSKGGGGIFITSASEMDLRNSILYFNSPTSIFLEDGTCTANYCDIESGWPGTEIITDDPLFVSGPYGDYYLSYADAGQPVSSPCYGVSIDQASSICYTTPIETFCMDQKTTRTDHVFDGGIINLGFHYTTPITVEVPSAFLTIQDAIDAALDSGTVLVADGTYTGPGNKNLDFNGKPITVRSQYGSDQCVIDCENSGRGFFFHNSEDSSSVLEGFTIKNGLVPDEDGGGIYCDSASPTISKCKIISNDGLLGSGIFCENYSSPYIINCEISSNSVRGIYCLNYSSPSLEKCLISSNNGGIKCKDYSLLTASNCLFVDNVCSSAGGAIQCHYYSSPTIINCIFYENQGVMGGAIRLFKGTHGIIENCIIVNNIATGKGGGIECLDFCDPKILNCVISNNSSVESGGGVFCGHYSDPTIQNILITQNVSLDGGGLAAEDFSSPEIINTTIVNNEAGIGSYGTISSYSSAEVTLTNSIIYFNFPYSIHLDSGDVYASDCDIEGSWSGGNFDSNPSFFYGTHGGYYLSQTIAGQATDSPCCDAGNDLAANICMPMSTGSLCFNDLTTRTDSITDDGDVDVGYHYSSDLPAIGKLNGYLLLERPGISVPDASYAVPVIVTLCSNSFEIASYSTTTNEFGEFSIDSIVGVYDVIVKSEHTMAKKFNSVVISDTWIVDNFEFGPLREGDANDDNIVNSADFFILKDTYNLSEGDPGYDDRADFNEDGTVTSADFFLLRNNYNQMGDEC